MKLIVAIISKDDERNVLAELHRHDFGATKLPTTGSFLKGKNTTLIIGVEKDQVEEVVALIKEKSRTREKVVVNATEIFGMSTGIDASSMEAEVGGAVMFVLDVESFIKV